MPENILLFAMRQFRPPSQVPSGSGLSQVAQILMYFQVSFVSTFDSWGRANIGRTCADAGGGCVARFAGGVARESSAELLSLRGLCAGRSLICSTWSACCARVAILFLYRSAMLACWRRRNSIIRALSGLSIVGSACFAVTS